MIRLAHRGLHLRERLFEVLRRHRRRRFERHRFQRRHARFAHERRQVGAAEAFARSTERDLIHAYVWCDGRSARERLQDGDSAVRRRQRNVQELVQAPGTQHRWIDHVGSVRRRDQERRVSRFETVHLGEKLVHDALG